MIAKNTIGDSTESAPNTGPILASTVPLPVTGLSAVSTLETALTLTWNTVSSSPQNGYAAVTDYKIHWNSGSGTTYTEKLGTTTNTVSASITGLTKGTAYSFKVIAVNKFGDGVVADASAVSIKSSLKP